MTDVRVMVDSRSVDDDDDDIEVDIEDDDDVAETPTHVGNQGSIL
jgi:hypothetical protein